MGIYGNVYKPIEPITEETQGLITVTEAELLKEAEEYGVLYEAKFHLLKLGDSSEYKKLSKDLKDAEQVLNANNESIDVNKVGHSLLHGTDKIIAAINGGATAGVAVGNLYFLPIALGAKLVSVGLKHGKEQEALGYANEAIAKLHSLLDDAESELEKQRIQNVIDKLEKSKHTLEVGKKAKRKEEKAVTKEDKALRKLEKKNDREDRRALRKAKRATRRNKNDDTEEYEDTIISQVEATNLLNFCLENGIMLSAEQVFGLQNIIESSDAPSSDNSAIKDVDFKTKENSRGEDPTINAARNDSSQNGSDPDPSDIEGEIEDEQDNDEFVNDYDEDVKKYE